MPKRQKNPENALHPIRTLVQIALELGPDPPDEGNPLLTDQFMAKAIRLAGRFPAFHSLAVQTDSREGRYARYHLCAWLVHLMYAIAEMNAKPQTEREPLPIPQSEPMVLRGGGPGSSIRRDGRAFLSTGQERLSAGAGSRSGQALRGLR